MHINESVISGKVQIPPGRKATSVDYREMAEVDVSFSTEPETVYTIDIGNAERSMIRRDKR